MAAGSHPEAMHIRMKAMSAVNNCCRILPCAYLHIVCARPCCQLVCHSPKGKPGLFLTQTEPASYHSGTLRTPAFVATCSKQTTCWTLTWPLYEPQFRCQRPLRNHTTERVGAHGGEKDACHCCHGCPCVHKLCLLEPA